MSHRSDTSTTSSLVESALEAAPVLNQHSDTSKAQDDHHQDQLAHSSQLPSSASDLASGIFNGDQETNHNNWGGIFQPGVGNNTHLILRYILIMLNLTLLFCAVMGINHPHSAIMFLLSVGLTFSYLWFMRELAKERANQNNQDLQTKNEPDTKNLDLKKTE